MITDQHVKELEAWYLYQMVAQNMLRTHEKKYGTFLRGKQIGFDNSVDAAKCLQQIESPDLLRM